MKKFIVFCLCAVMLVTGTALAAAEQQEEQYTDAMDQYQEVMNKWQQAKHRTSLRFTSEQLAQAQELMLRACEAMEAHLNLFAARVSAQPDFPESQEVMNWVDSQRSSIDSLAARVPEVTNRQEVRSLIREIHQQALQQRAAINRYKGLMLTARLRNTLTRVSERTERVSELLDQMNQGGIDTEQFQNSLADIQSRLAEIQGGLAEAHASFASITGPTNLNEYLAGRQLLMTSRQELRTVIDDLRALVKDIRKSLADHSLRVAGTGTITAAGSGVAIIAGSTLEDGEFYLRGSGTLIIQDYKGDAAINITGFGGKATLGEMHWQWQGEGEVRLSGSRVRVEIRGEDIALEARGRGIVYFLGTGSFTVNGSTREWSEQKQVTVEFN